MGLSNLSDKENQQIKEAVKAIMENEEVERVLGETLDPYKIAELLGTIAYDQKTAVPLPGAFDIPIRGGNSCRQEGIYLNIRPKYKCVGIYITLGGETINSAEIDRVNRVQIWKVGGEVTGIKFIREVGEEQHYLAITTRGNFFMAINTPLK